jgi:hypothetical protein
METFSTAWGNAMWRRTIIVTLVGLTACSGPEDAPSVHRLTADRIDASALVIGLPLSEKTVALSGNGRRRVTWKVSGTDALSSLEIIGNNQGDADHVGFSCAEFDAAGNSLPETRPGSLCRKLYGTLLSHFVTDGQQLADTLMAQAEKQKYTAGLIIGDFSFESYDGFNFVRRMSRLK